MSTNFVAYSSWCVICIYSRCVPMKLSVFEMLHSGCKSSARCWPCAAACFYLLLAPAVASDQVLYMHNSQCNQPTCRNHVSRDGEVDGDERKSNQPVPYVASRHKPQINQHCCSAKARQWRCHLHVRRWLRACMYIW